MKKHHLGKKLKELRRIQGLTQRELARRTGLHITTIANYEINRREPKANQLKVLAEALGVDMDKLLTTKISNEDGRGSIRRYLIAEAVVKLPKSIMEIPALVLNISANGIGIYSVEKLKVHEPVILKLKILMKGGPTATEEIPGKIVWTDLVESRYASGIEFEQPINSKDFPVLSMCIEYNRALSNS